MEAITFSLIFFCINAEVLGGGGMGGGGWGMGDWGLGIGDWAQSPIPNPQSPIPNPQSPKQLKYFFCDIKLTLNYIRK